MIEPPDVTFYSGCIVTRQYTGEKESGAFATLPWSGKAAPYNAVDFQNGYWPRPSYTTQITFRAYPYNKDHVLGTPVSVTVTLNPHSPYSLLLSQSNPSSMGNGVIIDPLTGQARGGTANAATSILLDWDFSLSPLGALSAYAQWKSDLGWVTIRDDGDAQGHYCRLTFHPGAPNYTYVNQDYTFAPWEKFNIRFRWRQSATAIWTATFYWRDSAKRLMSYSHAIYSPLRPEQHLGQISMVGMSWFAPPNTGNVLLEFAVISGGPLDIAKVVIQPRW